MTVRIIVGALVAGVVVFAWGAVSHMVLGLGEVGMKKMPNEESILSTLGDNVREHGLFCFPWIEQSERANEAKSKEWEEKLKNGPSGIMVYKPSGGAAMTIGQLFREFAANTAWCLIAACLLAVAAPRLPQFGTRVLFVAVM